MYSDIIPGREIVVVQCSLLVVQREINHTIAVPFVLVKVGLDPGLVGL